MNFHTLPIKSINSLKQIMRQYYRELDSANIKKDKKIAWCTSQGPVELLRAMGFLVYFPENHAAMLGTSRKAMDLIPHANAIGYSPDICSYLTSDIGSYLIKQTPLCYTYGISGIPEPDVIVYNNNQCRDVQEWFQFYAHQYKVPVFGIRTPRGIGPVNREVINYITKQLKSLAKDLTSISGKSLNHDTFCEVVSLSRKASDLWKKILYMAINRPSPISFFDTCIHIGPAVVLRGTNSAIQYYKELFKEIKKRKDNNIGVIKSEKFRLYWDGMPIWGKIRWFSETLSIMGASVVSSTYAHSWIFDALDPDNPFESMAIAYTELFTVRDEPSKEDFLMEMIGKFMIDGIIFHNSRTCSNCTNSHYGMPQRVTRKTGIPYLVIDGDLNDLRCFSQEQTLTNLEAFIEILEQKY